MLRPLLASVAVLALGGCFAVQEKTFGESWDEAQTGTQIKSRLFGKGAFSRFGEVDVEVADRFVLLSGRVPSDADRAEAERIAWSVPSVDEVANELVVDARDIGRDFNDRWITEQVRTRMFADSDIKGVNYNVQVYAGVVYLLGWARSEDELREAAEIAARVKGVQKVVSYVKMRERAAPAALQAEAPSAPSQPVDIRPSDYQDPAPIVPVQPTSRGQYRDPYAPGSAPPPGASNNSGGLQSAPLAPLNPG